MPTLLQPDYSKADLPKLINDIPKWHSVMSVTSKEWWRVFLDGIDKDLVQPSDDDCPLFSLKETWQRPVRPEANVQSLPEINMEFREKEIAPLEQVYCRVNNCVTVQTWIHRTCEQPWAGQCGSLIRCHFNMS